MKYYPFGGTRSGSVPTDLQFTGQRLDATGLYYYNARYYDPEIGRFISADTFVQWSTPIDVISYPLAVNKILQTNAPAITRSVPVNSQTFNRYSYVVNNPLKYNDPTGWDTDGDGFNFNAAFGVGFSVELMGVRDGKGNTAQAFTFSFLGATPSVSAGQQYQHTTAKVVTDLSEWSGGGGASASVWGRLGIGGEYVGYKRSTEHGWEGWNISGTYTFQGPPAETHAVIFGYTWLFNIKNNSDRSSIPDVPNNSNQSSQNPSFNLPAQSSTSSGYNNNSSVDQGLSAQYDSYVPYSYLSSMGFCFGSGSSGTSGGSTGSSSSSSGGGGWGGCFSGFDGSAGVIGGY